MGKYHAGPFALPLHYLAYAFLALVVTFCAACKNKEAEKEAPASNSNDFVGPLDFIAHCPDQLERAVPLHGDGQIHAESIQLAEAALTIFVRVPRLPKYMYLTLYGQRSMSNSDPSPKSDALLCIDGRKAGDWQKVELAGSAARDNTGASEYVALRIRGWAPHTDTLLMDIARSQDTLHGRRPAYKSLTLAPIPNQSNIDSVVHVSIQRIDAGVSP